MIDCFEFKSFFGSLGDGESDGFPSLLSVVLVFGFWLVTGLGEVLFPEAREPSFPKLRDDSLGDGRLFRLEDAMVGEGEGFFGPSFGAGVMGFLSVDFFDVSG